MCEPMTMGALAIASSAFGTYSQYKSASAQQDAINTQRTQQNEELQAKADVEAGERVKQARAERARMLVAAGESGVSGASFEAQLRDSLFQQSQDVELIGKQLGFDDRASATRAAGAMAGVNKPNALTAGLQIASAGYSGYSQGLSIKNAKTVGDS